MPKHTENFGLIKPLQDEYYNIDDFNTNADVIDEAIQGAIEISEGRMPSNATPPLPSGLAVWAPGSNGWVRLVTLSREADGGTMDASFYISELRGLRRGGGILKASLTYDVTPLTPRLTWICIDNLDPNNFRAFFNTTARTCEIWAFHGLPTGWELSTVKLDETRNGVASRDLWTVVNTHRNPVASLPSGGSPVTTSGMPMGNEHYGQYTGDGAGSRVIPLGFRPRATFIMSNSGETSANSGGGLAIAGFDAMSSTSPAVSIIRNETNGFRITALSATAGTNVVGKAYNFIAFR